VERALPFGSAHMRAIALVLVGLFAHEQTSFRTGVALVRLDAEVTDRGQPVEDLVKEDFRVTDNGEPREIVHFGHEEEPLDVILLFDTSLSMQPVVERIAQTGNVALAELRAGDRVAVMAFSRGSDLLLDFTVDVDAVRTPIRRVLDRPFIPSSELQRAIDDGARHFLKEPRTNRRRAILAITDGLGNGRAADAVENLWNADAVVSGMIVRNAGMTVLFRTMRPDTLFSGGMGGIADDTGGEGVKFDDAGEGLRQMIHRLRRRYTLAYAMPDAAPGQRRTIKVELAGDAARRYRQPRIRARTGYIVPTSAEQR
jgi:Ca-activated chloride channel family protein